MPSTKPAAQERRKVTVNYDPDTPRCYNCIHRGYNRDQISVCRKNAFAILPVGLCDDWTDKNGETLEGK